MQLQHLRETAVVTTDQHQQKQQQQQQQQQQQHQQQLQQQQQQFEGKTFDLRGNDLPLTDSLTLKQGCHSNGKNEVRFPVQPLSF